MPRRKYIINLSEIERHELLELTRKGELKARKMKRAMILLKADEGLSDPQIMTAIDVSRLTVERIHKRFVEGGLERALIEDPRPGQRRKLDGRGEAQVIRVVLDNLNSHKPGALYVTFSPAEARRILRRLEFHFTPKHTSWLNMAEIEWSVYSRNLP